jgi:anion-transporting  ArsA/GET3 family ATPase
VQRTVPAGPLKDNAVLLDAMLTDRQQTRVHLVTTPAEMPVTEVNALYTGLSELHIAAGLCIINRHEQPLPPLPTDAFAEPALAPLREALSLRAARWQAGEDELRKLAPNLAKVSLPQLSTLHHRQATSRLAAMQSLAELLAPHLERV